MQHNGKDCFFTAYLWPVNFSKLGIVSMIEYCAEIFGLIMHTYI